MSARSIGARLQALGQRVAVAETSAGGRLSSLLLTVPGASNWVAGGVIGYSEAAREGLLGMRPGDLGMHGAVSEEAALALARAVRTRCKVDWAVAETGIAGPQTGRRSTKPAGLCCLAVVGPNTELTRTAVLPDTGRSANMRGFARAAAALLDEALQQSHAG